MVKSVLRRQCLKLSHFPTQQRRSKDLQMNKSEIVISKILEKKGLLCCCIYLQLTK